MQIQKLISLPPVMAALFHTLEQKDPGEWHCDSDPAEKKVGSGGGTASILASAFRADKTRGSFAEWISVRKRMVIHSGGESRRLPAYAPYGKSLLPVPVFRWSKGQHLDQKLLDFQSAFYERILKNAPDSYCTLVGTGDVMIIASDRFNKLPDADVLLFGIWVDDATASGHGVFFSRRSEPEQLAFVKQKPSQDELREYSGDYFYLMDSGIVLMNQRSVMKLMEKTGWDEKAGSFTGGLPGFYDLYGEMLTSFGPEADHPDPSLKGFDVRLIPLHEAEFYHFGSNSDLIGSTLRLQNRITDQRLRFTGETDHHPSIFQQNSEVKQNFGEENHCIWIENSYIPATWGLKHHHILTGIPENHWKLDLAEDICLDAVPVAGGAYCLRPYGFFDRFRETLSGAAAWMNQPIGRWFESRSISLERAGIRRTDPVYEMPLFPIVEKEDIPRMLEFMLGGKDRASKWINARRLSAKEISGEADPQALYGQRETLKAAALPVLAAHYRKSIFYYLDLEKTAADFRTLGLDLPAELKKEEPVIRRIHDSMFRARVTGNQVLAASFEEKAFRILREEMIDTLRSDPVRPGRNLLDDQIIWGRSPVRLDLAGGWTDTPPYCIMEGGKVVNLSVELNGQLPLQVYARPLEEHKIVLRSIDLGEMLEIKTFDDLDRYDRPGGGFSIPMAALVLAGFSPEFSEGSFHDLGSQLRDFGCGIELSLLAAIPKGSGLGTSSNLAATVLGTLSEFCGLNWDKHDISYRTLILEQMLTTGGGWQDQAGAIT